MMAADREWKGERSNGDLLDNHDDSEADCLHESEEVNSSSLDVAEIDQIRLIFHGHRQNIQPFNELQTKTTQTQH